MPNLISTQIIATRIAEVQHIAQLPGYECAIEELVKAVYQENIQIGFWREPRSKLDYQFDGAGKPYAFWITLKRTPLLESRKDVLYDLLHEMGHYWDDEDRPIPRERQPPKIQRKREERAWAYADVQFDSIPELQADWSEYEAYKHRL